MLGTTDSKVFLGLPESVESVVVDADAVVVSV
jgi:hypothetical protein